MIPDAPNQESAFSIPNQHSQSAITNNPNQQSTFGIQQSIYLPRDLPRRRILILPLANE
jgi:hypothetical protein